MALICNNNHTYKHITNMYESCLTISHVIQHYISRNTQKRVNINSYFHCGPLYIILYDIGKYHSLNEISWHCLKKNEVS